MTDEYIGKNSAFTATADAIREKGDSTELVTWDEETGFAAPILAIKGGADLNFEVVGGTSQPANPKENTIWVDTDQEITSWIFSAEEPETPEAGMVWFNTSTSSTVKFNALKDEGLIVYPLGAEQFAGSSWKNTPAMIYQGDKWEKLITYLYNNGDECIKNGGEWEAVSAYYNTNGAWQGQTLSLNKANDGLEMSTRATYPFPQGLVRKSKKIDMKHTTLYAEFEWVTLSGNLDYNASVSVAVLDDLNTGAISEGLAKADALRTTVATTIPNKIVNIPVSRFVGEYAIGIWLSCPSDTNISVSAKLKKMWLE